MAKNNFWSNLWKGLKTFFTGGFVGFDGTTVDSSDMRDFLDDGSVNSSQSDGTALGNLVDNLSDKYAGTGLTDAEQEANSFTAQLQEDQQAYNAAEAEKAYQREVDFYEKYTSPKAQMSQLIEAGVNPFAAGGAISGGSNLSGPVASSGSGGSVAPHGADLAGLIGVFSQLAGLKANIEKTRAETRNIDASTENINKNTSWIDRLNSMSLSESKQRISESVSNILLNVKDMQVRSAQISEIAVGIANTEADTDVKRQQAASLLVQMQKDLKSVEVMDEQIKLMASERGLNRAEASRIAQEYRNLVQLHGHNEVVNAMTELSLSRDTGESGKYYRVMSEVKRFVDSCLSWWSGSTSISHATVSAK